VQQFVKVMHRMFLPISTLISLQLASEAGRLWCPEAKLALLKAASPAGSGIAACLATSEISEPTPRQSRPAVRLTLDFN
jgi:hypothetical protein